jgi:L-asparaginase II
MQRIGLDDTSYACGPAWPPSADDRDARVAAGERASSYFNNCSGKHAGMLSVCVYERLPVASYAKPEHPLQRRILRGLSSLIGREIGLSELGTDGCNLPAIPLTMREMATAVARFASAKGVNDRQSAAMRRLLDAMRRHPDHVSGRGQATQMLCETTQGRVLMKTGAEGYLVAWLPEDGLGIAIKTCDGADRVRVPVLLELLSQLDLIGKREVEALEALRRPTLTNSAERKIGSICSCFRCG